MWTNSPASPSGRLYFLQIWPHRWDFYHKPEFVNLPSKLTDRFLLPDFNINRNISSKHSFLCICFKQPMVKWPRRLKFWNCSTPTGDGTALVTHCCCFLSFSSPPQVFLNQSFASEPLPDTDVTISLPSELDDYFVPGEGNKTRVQFHFYGSQKLFQVHKHSLVFSIFAGRFQKKTTNLHNNGWIHS